MGNFCSRACGRCIHAYARLVALCPLGAFLAALALAAGLLYGVLSAYGLPTVDMDLESYLRVDG